jgi:hypothetical protein
MRLSIVQLAGEGFPDCRGLATETLTGKSITPKTALLSSKREIIAVSGEPRQLPFDLVDLLDLPTGWLQRHRTSLEEAPDGRLVSLTCGWLPTAAGASVPTQKAWDHGGMSTRCSLVRGLREVSFQRERENSGDQHESLVGNIWPSWTRQDRRISIHY